MKKILCLILLASACAAEPTSTVAQPSTTCVSDPLAPGGDTDGDLVAQCHYQQTYDATAASAPASAVGRVSCEAYPGLITCNITWSDQGDCKIVSCSYSDTDGLVCSPVGNTALRYCD